MTRLLICMVLTGWIQSAIFASPTHLDIMVPDIRDTDLKGPVKSVSLKVWPNMSAEPVTVKKEYDRTGNLLSITEYDQDDELVDTTTYFYDEKGCYKRMQYENEEKGFANEWKVVLEPETRQIALQEVKDGRIRIETYSPEGYLLKYRLLGKNRQPILTNEYKRDENNRRTKYTRIEGRKPAYTFYYKWAENGFIDMEAQIFHQEKEKCRNTYEYLVTDDHGNWTQRIMVRYNVSGKKPRKFYENTVQREIEYYDEETAEDDKEAAEDGDAYEEAANDGDETAEDEQASEPEAATDTEEEADE